MLALCSMLSGTYYAHYYASIIGESLAKRLESDIEEIALTLVVKLCLAEDIISQSSHKVSREFRHN